jgi:phospholipid/cholesterol/gamma-HCH transport system substrate-binding protein
MYDLKKQLAWSKLKVGAVISIALLVLLAAVFFAGGIETLISPKETITAHFKDVRGLRKGSPVWLAGIEVGSVRSINLDPRYGTIVAISISKNVLPYLKKDARATIQTMGLLGDKYIELISGSPAAQTLSPGEMITGVPEAGIQDMVASSGVLMQKMDNLIGQLGDIAGMIGEGKGTISLLLKDPALYNNLRTASKELASITAELRDGKGTLGRLMGDDLLYQRLLSATQSFEKFGVKLNEGGGTLNRLAEDDTLYDRLLGATTSLEEFSLKLNKGPGSLNRFAEDPQLYDNLAEATGRLNAMLRRVEEGEGAAGALISDEEVARELKDTIRELKELTADVRNNPRRYFRFSVF